MRCRICRICWGFPAIPPFCYSQCINNHAHVSINNPRQERWHPSSLPVMRWRDQAAPPYPFCRYMTFSGVTGDMSRHHDNTIYNLQYNVQYTWIQYNIQNTILYNIQYVTICYTWIQHTIQCTIYTDTIHNTKYNKIHNTVYNVQYSVQYTWIKHTIQYNVQDGTNNKIITDTIYMDKTYNTIHINTIYYTILHNIHYKQYNTYKTLFTIQNTIRNTTQYTIRYIWIQCSIWKWYKNPEVPPSVNLSYPTI